MSLNRVPLPQLIVHAFLRASLLFAAGGFALWKSRETRQMPSPELSDGWFPVMVIGAVLVGLGLVTFIVVVMKGRAPTLRQDKSAEPGEEIFDPDIALQRYLATRKAEPAPADVAAPPLTRPAFGRRSPSAPRPLD